MKNIYKYEDFLEKQIIDYIDFSINESQGIKTIWDKTISKLKNLSAEAKFRVMKHLMVSLLAFNSIFAVTNMVNQSSADQQTKDMAIEIINKKSKEDIPTEEISPEKDDKWKKGYEFEISEKGIKHIKEEETLKLKAYQIGDGMVTIGYGHAEPASKSNYKVGDVITEEEAEQLLKKDLKVFSEGVKKIFRDWEEKGRTIEITQEMFDALVSISFNTGVGGLRGSSLIQDIKRGKFEEAGKKIKTFRVSKKFPGLASRREKESKLFLSSV